MLLMLKSNVRFARRLDNFTPTEIQTMLVRKLNSNKFKPPMTRLALPKGVENMTSNSRWPTCLAVAKAAWVVRVLKTCWAKCLAAALVEADSSQAWEAVRLARKVEDDNHNNPNAQRVATSMLVLTSLPKKPLMEEPSHSPSSA